MNIQITIVAWSWVGTSPEQLAPMVPLAQMAMGYHLYLFHFIIVWLVSLYYTCLSRYIVIDCKLNSFDLLYFDAGLKN